MTVDIFALRRGSARGDRSRQGRPSRELLHASTFAVGEEGAGVARGGSADRRAREAGLSAPLGNAAAPFGGANDLRVDVVVRTRKIGHFFPGGTVDAFDCWLELKAGDDTGRMVFWSGVAVDDERPGRTRRTLLPLAADRRPRQPHQQAQRLGDAALVYVRLIPPGAADTVRFRVEIPRNAGYEITLTAN